MLTRRSTAAPHAAGNTPGSGALPRGAFRFLVVNDLHHATAECDPFLEGLVRQMRTHTDVAFLLVVGDLADRGEPSSLASVGRILRGLGAPVYTVPGNHDNDATGDTSTYAKVFPDALNYRFTHRGWQFIGLDSTDGYGWNDTRVSADALDFLDTTVPKLDPKAPTIAFTHFPLGPGIRMRPLNADAVLERLTRLDLRAAFCGHYHSRTIRTLGDALVTTNVCCARVRANHDGSKEEGYLVCTAHPDGQLIQEFVEYRPASAPPDPPPPLAS